MIKKVLWLSYSNRGSSHDSSCFRESKLYKKLCEISEYLFKNEFFLIGDSAYSIDSFILTSHDQTLSKSKEDDFNFYHSSARITVECAFGEIDLRWGIFWKILTCSLNNASLIIEGAMHLHNYLVEYRNANRNNEIINDTDLFNEIVTDVGAESLQVGNDLGRPRGRTTNVERSSRHLGLFIRNKLTNSLSTHGLYKPRKEEWIEDNNTHVQRI